MPDKKLPHKLTSTGVRRPNFYEGITLVGVVTAALGIGGMAANVKQILDRLDKLDGAVSESKDSLLSRTSVIETKLDAMDKKIEIDRKLEELKKLEETLRNQGLLRNQRLLEKSVSQGRHRAIGE